MARSDPMADDSLPDMRARSRPGHGDRRDDADDRDDDQQLDQREPFWLRIFMLNLLAEVAEAGSTDVGRSRLRGRPTRPHSNASARRRRPRPYARESDGKVVRLLQRGGNCAPARLSTFVADRTVCVNRGCRDLACAVLGDAPRFDVAGAPDAGPQSRPQSRRLAIAQARDCQIGDRDARELALDATVPLLRFVFLRVVAERAEAHAEQLGGLRP